MQEVSGASPLGSTKPFAKQKASRGSRFEEAMRAQRNSPYNRYPLSEHGKRCFAIKIFRPPPAYWSLICLASCHYAAPMMCTA